MQDGFVHIDKKCAASTYCNPYIKCRKVKNDLNPALSAPILGNKLSITKNKFGTIMIKQVQQELTCRAGTIRGQLQAMTGGKKPDEITAYINARLREKAAPLKAISLANAFSRPETNSKWLCETLLPAVRLAMRKHKNALQHLEHLIMKEGGPSSASIVAKAQARSAKLSLSPFEPESAASQKIAASILPQATGIAARPDAHRVRPARDFTYHK
jgi:hypothetical protein